MSCAAIGVLDDDAGKRVLDDFGRDTSGDGESGGIGVVNFGVVCE